MMVAWMCWICVEFGKALFFERGSNRTKAQTPASVSIRPCTYVAAPSLRLNFFNLLAAASLILSSTAPCHEAAKQLIWSMMLSKRALALLLFGAGNLQQKIGCDAFAPSPLRSLAADVAQSSRAITYAYSNARRHQPLPLYSSAAKDDVESIPSVVGLGGPEQSGGFDVDEMTARLLESSETIAADVLKSAMPVCAAWSKTNSGRGAAICEQVLYKVAQQLIAGNEEAYKNIPWPNLCTVVLDAWATSGEDGAAEKAEALVGGMADVSERTDGKVPPPSIIAYNTVLKAYARQAASGGNAAEAAERILNELEERAGIPKNGETNNDVDDEDECEVNSVQPNQVSYTTVIDCYAKSGLGKEAAEGAERIFRRMERAYESGCSEARPSVPSFNTVIDAWVKSGLVRGPIAAEEILKKMISLHEKGIKDVEPTVVSFSSVMNGWAKSQQDGSAERALEVYQLMEDMREAGTITATPNAYTYSILIDALCKAGMLAEAENVFNNIVKNYAEDQSSPKPNKIQATQIMDSIAKSGDSAAGVKTEVLLTTLERLYEKYEDKDMRPSKVSYTACINSWAKSKAFEKSRKARETLDRMIEAYKNGNGEAKPNVNAFTAVINACAFTQGDILEKKDALQIATKSYKEFYASDYGEPNQFMFATFLRVCANIIPPGEQRVSSMKSVLQQAANQGKVDDLVLKVLQKSLSADDLGSILPCEVTNNILTRKDLPAEWTCNLDAGRRRNRQGSRIKRK